MCLLQQPLLHSQIWDLINGELPRAVLTNGNTTTSATGSAQTTILNNALPASFTQQVRGMAACTCQ